MSLPSQGGIGFGGATRGRRRRGGGGGGRKILAAVLVIAVAGSLVWAFSSGGDSPENTNPDADSAGLALAQPQTRGPRRTIDPGRSEAGSARLVGTPSQAQHTEPQPQSRTVEQPEGQDQAAKQTPGDAPAGVLATPVQDTPVFTSPARPSAAVATLVERAEQALKANEPVAAREHYNQALMHERATTSDRASIRQQMAALNADLIFSPRVYPNDPFSTKYTVQGGDSLSRIAQNEGVATEWRLIQRVNRLSNPGGIFEGQTLKLVRGPFNAVVTKSAYRMDVYIGPPEEIDQWVYVRSFPVGLGELDGTPVGAFTVRRHSKLIDPFWRNPRTGEEFSASDPENPIGEHWIGLEGLGQAEAFSGYGIHGTVEPESIGQSMSMGCVRMLPDDVALVYELLTEQISQVHIVE
ncbi:MAG: LysM peptidoglycan-binding domain-containing protein [Phycisphaera sp.]|nr:MAG: LysM peptidoglycan-binding domain-containing protein [Phycisphaera sp.]